MLEVEGALARAHAALRLIPPQAAASISDAARRARVPSTGLADQVGVDGVPVPALLRVLRADLAPEHGAWAYWGATSQDVVDTALVLRLRDLLTA